MPWSIELYIDEEHADAIRAVAPEISTPHVSLGVAESIDQTQLEPILRDWANSNAFIPVTFDHWGMFLSESAVLFIAPRERIELDTVHRDFHQRAAKLLVNEWEYYRPPVGAALHDCRPGGPHGLGWIGAKSASVVAAADCNVEPGGFGRVWALPG